MAEKPTDGVIVAITNLDRSEFYIQQKDSRYPDARYRGHYSLFGGALEGVESPEQALRREIYEELNPIAAYMVLRHAEQFGTFTANEKDRPFYVTLFESVVPQDEFLALTGKPIKEGIPKLVKRDQLKELPFIYGLEKVIAQYLDSLLPTG